MFVKTKNIQIKTYGTKVVLRSTPEKSFREGLAVKKIH